MGGRECACSCDTFALILRVVTFIGYLALMAAAGWGFPLANARFVPPGSSGNGTSTVDANAVINQLNSLSGSFAVFQGLMAVYFFVFGAVGLLAELRTKFLRRTALLHLSFLTSYFGRGLFAIYVGSVLVVIPWDDQRPFVSKVPGGLLTGMGALQLLFWLFVRKDTSRRVPPSSANAALLTPASAASQAKLGGASPGGAGGATSASNIAWGEPESPVANGGGGGGGRSDYPPVAVDPPSSQHRLLLVAQSLPRANVFANPVHHAALAATAASSGSGSPPPADNGASDGPPPGPPAAETEEARNPFLKPPPPPESQ